MRKLRGKELIRDFMAYTGTDYKTALDYLEAEEWVLGYALYTYRLDLKCLHALIDDRPRKGERNVNHECE